MIQTIITISLTHDFQNLELTQIVPKIWNLTHQKTYN